MEDRSVQQRLLIVVAVIVIAFAAGGAIALGPQDGLRLYLTLGGGLLFAGSFSLLRNSSLVGLYVGLYMLGRHLIGGSITNPGLVLLVLDSLTIVVLFMGAVNNFVLWSNIVRRGSFWIGSMPLVLSVVGALLSGGLYLFGLRTVPAAITILALMVFARGSYRHLYGVMAGVGFGLSVAMLAGGISPLQSERFQGGAFAETHPNLLGVFAAFLAVAWICLPTHRRWLLITTPVLVSTLILTDSRTSIVAAAVGSLFVFRSVWARIALVAFSSTVLASLGIIQAIVRPRSGQSDSLTGRSFIWEQGIKQWHEATLMGKLLGSNVEVYTQIRLPNGNVFVAHNALLDALLRGGVLGLVCVVIGLGIVLVKLKFALPTRTIPALVVALALMALSTTWTEAFLIAGPAWWWLAVSESVAFDANGGSGAQSHRKNVSDERHLNSEMRHLLRQGNRVFE